MKRMRKMKDSGVEWIGQIPESWETIKLSYLFNAIGSGTTPNSSNGEFYDGEHNWLQTGDLTDGYITTTSKTITQEAVDSCSALTLFKKGAVVIAMYGATIGKLGILDIDCYTNQACCALSEPINTNSKFVYYWLLCNRENIVRLSLGGGQPNISQGIITSLKVSVPTSITEQSCIVDYLDRKCAAIDELIAAKEKTNALLKERRQSIIYEAVTKGLNPDATMKDSGIEWIGQIPEHWNMMRTKFFAEITNGSDPKTEGDIPVYGSGSESFRTCGEFKEGPVVLLGRKGATLHIPHYVEGKYWNVDTAFDVRTNEKICLLKFYYYASICFDYKLYISTTTLPSMTQYNYGNMFIPIPSVEEQAEILKHIERKLSELDQVITSTEDNIQKLKEYRQSIIYEAVTGKIEI